ncbi:MAG: SEC-C metal-binding domain-containing protein, partial [Syntrophomonadaceae bacterium]|nr:SEC-C metal-binding domain-containing protein [Syntrophomonadaceae bacterium]
PDVIYRTEEGKFRAVVEEIAACHRRGQPTLVGTISIEKSERLSRLLQKRGIPHQVLNAKHHEKEAAIIAQAGRKGAVTIATNMAGRGTDILLGGNPEFLAQQKVRELFDPAVEAAAEPDQRGREKKYQETLNQMKKITDIEHQEVVSLGGLHIIGTERHEARRIDNQLRGRSGRQGDPGSSRFYISLEDDLMRIFGAEMIGGVMDRLGMDDSMPIEHPLVSRSIENAQKKVEARNFEIRKNVLQYDDVMNQQREVIYEQRRKVLFGDNLREVILDMLEKQIDSLVDSYAAESQYPENWDLVGLLEYARQNFLPSHRLRPEDLRELTPAEVKELLQEQAEAYYASREAELGEETVREIERAVLLRVVDSKWMDHLDAMDQLKQGIGLRAYGQRDPLVEYKYEAYQMFNEMIAAIREEAVRWAFQARLIETPAPASRRLVENRQEDQAPQPVRSESRVGRNDPCPCGSGKKYKRCCGR